METTIKYTGGSGQIPWGDLWVEVVKVERETQFGLDLP